MTVRLSAFLLAAALALAGCAGDPATRFGGGYAGLTAGGGVAKP